MCIRDRTKPGSQNSGSGGFAGFLRKNPTLGRLCRSSSPDVQGGQHEPEDSSHREEREGEEGKDGEFDMDHWIIANMRPYI